MFNANAVQVDWRQLRRWHIDEARVPPDAIVHFREPGIWDRYRTHVLAALMLLITQSLLIAGLLVQRSRRRRAEDELRESQRELRDSFERIRALGARLLSAQETERARIARELHDDICQRMLLLTIELQALERSHPGAAPAAEALTVAKDIAKSLHELSHRLHPTRLRVIGLVGALDRLCHEVSRAGLTITYTHEGVPPALEPELTLCLFRVVQEALQNAIKYSQASQVSVELRGNANGLTLSVADDGVGFDVGAELGKGVGLLSMIERVEAAGGMLDIRSAPGGGTSLLAIVPLQARASLRRTPLAASGAN
jgi:signal transduction histidine kinase